MVGIITIMNSDDDDRYPTDIIVKKPVNVTENTKQEGVQEQVLGGGAFTNSDDDDRYPTEIIVKKPINVVETRCRKEFKNKSLVVEQPRTNGDATKGVLFTDFPPVLQLLLKRFDYKCGSCTMKINDHYVYPLQLDLDRDNGKYLSPEAEKRVRNLYTLHSVLVHSDGGHCGPYYAFIGPTLSDQWFKFHGERVTKEDMKRALEEQYGGEEKVITYHGFSSTLSKAYSHAYMLVYIRESDKEKIMCTMDEEDIAEHLRTRLKKENEEKEHKESKKEEDRMYTTIKVAQQHDLFEHIGRDVRFDLVDFNEVRSFRIENQRPFIHLKKMVSEKFCIPEQFQWFWLWAKCENDNYCLSRPLTFQEEQQSVGQLREILNNASSAELKLFFDVKYWPNFRPISLLDKTEDDIFLFFKLYDPDKIQFRYVGNLFVKGSDKPVDILTILNGMADFDLNQEIELYKEIKIYLSDCEQIDKELTFRSSQIENGDLICFQKSLPLEGFVEYQYPRLCLVA
ncbi:ubiquitin C-terminal hydrolase 13-like [Macadamia integrifolia]|uniref:ubiquitin C-terminal hydrolase 13-like n=1 Tax=Macadamia integrifolia TaxID=60698 RepID=UPI001C4E4D53|nr:ubiquitin C-terminal hydrolase 13-like [Macadamia integrifolia]